MDTVWLIFCRCKSLKSSKGHKVARTSVSEDTGNLYLLSCPALYLFFSLSTLAVNLDNEWQNRWMGDVCHSPVWSGCSCTNQRRCLSMWCADMGRSLEGTRGMPATPSFPKARVLNTHTRICTHSSAVLQKGFPCVADESTRGWKAEQLSYTMGGWGGQLHSEGCCH